jgi:hypothetical protein
VRSKSTHAAFLHFLLDEAAHHLLGFLEVELPAWGSGAVGGRE